jgi:hypothetical protein
VPSAVRKNDKTTIIRMKDVIIIRIDGARLRTVTRAIIWIIRAVDSPPDSFPPKSRDRLCASAELVSHIKIALRQKQINVALAKVLTVDLRRQRWCRGVLKFRKFLEIGRNFTLYPLA